MHRHICTLEFQDYIYILSYISAYNAEHSYENREEATNHRRKQEALRRESVLRDAYETYAGLPRVIELFKTALLVDAANLPSKEVDKIFEAVAEMKDR